MKPEVYRTYAEVFDYFFADGRLFPAAFGFVRALASFLNSGDKVAEVGGGTGVFTRHLLLWRPGLQLTFVEPSREMLVLARAKLPSTVRFLEMPCHEALHCLDPGQQAIFFMRSFYAAGRSRDDYPALLAGVRQSLAKRGVLGIMDFSGPLELSLQWKERCRQVLVSSPQELAAFNSNWRVLEHVWDGFNQGITDGTYFVFSLEEMHRLLAEAGFQRLWAKRRPVGYSLIYQVSS